ncbi:MAG: ion channel [Verrucomicrobiales bacterium]|nr:ion channel [Verrucomicrobiales bacterium]
MPSTDPEQQAPPFHRRHKNAILLATLLVLILASPLIQVFEGYKLLDMLLSTAVMAASLNAVSYRKRSTFFWALCLTSLAVISGWTQAIDHIGPDKSHTYYLVLAHSFGAALYLYIAALLFRVIITQTQITVDQLFAAVVIYIFIGLSWAHFYGLSEAFQNNSISGNTETDPNFIYFSFVTLTTLGYGDMLPITPMAKALAIIEAITGVMFVAILVSTLVGRVNRNR